MDNGNFFVVRNLGIWSIEKSVKVIMTHNEDVCGETVEVIKGDLENTNGDRGQICDFVIRKRGRADVKFTVTYYTGVDASQSTNSLPAPLVSIVTVENDELKLE